MLPPSWTPLKHHAKQSRLWRTKCRFCCVAAGRGSGKTELSRRYVVRWLPVTKPWPRPMYFYAMPTYNHAKRVAWQPIKDLIPKHWLKRPPLESDLMIETVFGSQLWVVGLDKPQRIEGSQWDGGIIDESCDQKPGVFDRSILPALSHRDGWCWRIGVPKRYGVGAMEFHDACMACDGEQSLYFNWPSTDILTEEQLSFARANLDERDFREQYLATWESASGLIYYAFDPVLNVRETVYHPGLPLIIGSDFNVDPMCWVICQRHGRELHVLDEFFIRNTNTLATLDRLFARFGKHQAGFEFYGDATGRARKTAAAESDYNIIRGDKRFVRKHINYPRSNPAVKDRFAACNALLLNADGERRCIIDPRCTVLIKDLRTRAYIEGTCEPNDGKDQGHMADAWGYVVYMLFRIGFAIEGKAAVYSA